AFDGRFLYLAPYDSPLPHGNVARYDTQASFTAAASWSTFDTSAGVNTNAKGFRGTAFDGRFVYFVPWNNAAPDGVVARYDTQAAFGTATSWSTFDTSTVDPSATGFAGAAFDGRYVYLVPANDGLPDGVVARYDAQAGFTDAASWSTFDVTTVDKNAKGFL